jgi:phosphoribosylamine-glycine ligase
MAKILMLGAGECQLNLIRRLKSTGHEVHIADYYSDSSGKKGNPYNYLISTYNLEDNLTLVKNEGIDCVMTAGTDQPVKTIGYINDQLGKKSFLDFVQSCEMTNKILMKQKFVDCGIPTVAYQLINRQTKSREIRVSFPAVVKPADSQGQRGIFLVRDYNELMTYIEETFHHTREDAVVLETYYPSNEITVTGWVENGKTHVLAIVDRETFHSGAHIGICKGHRYPSIHFDSHKDEIVRLTEEIVEVFKIKNGPIYFQILLGDEGLKVNEVAARIGGAYEDEYIPLATGVDLLGLLIDRSLGYYDHEYLREGHYLEIKKYLYTALIFSDQTHVNDLKPMEELIGHNGVVSGKWFIKKGQDLPMISNATQRIGYAIIQGETEAQLNGNLEKFWKSILIEVKTNE